MNNRVAFNTKNKLGLPEAQQALARSMPMNTALPQRDETIEDLMALQGAQTIPGPQAAPLAPEPNLMDMLSQGGGELMNFLGTPGALRAASAFAGPTAGLSMLEGATRLDQEAALRAQQAQAKEEATVAKTEKQRLEQQKIADERAFKKEYKDYESKLDTEKQQAKQEFESKQLVRKHELDMERDQLKYTQQALKDTKKPSFDKLKDTVKTSFAGLAAVSKSFDRFEAIMTKLPEHKITGIWKGLMAKAVPDKDVREFEAQRTILFNTIARTIGAEKGPLNEGDINRIKQSVPDMNDSKEEKAAKMVILWNELNGRANTLAQANGLTIQDLPFDVSFEAKARRRTGKSASYELSNQKKQSYQKKYDYGEIE